MTQGFSSPQATVQMMLTLLKELSDNEADLLLRCARAVAIHHVQQGAAPAAGDRRQGARARGDDSGGLPSQRMSCPQQ